MVIVVIIIIAGTIGAVVYKTIDTNAKIALSPLSPSVRAGGAMAFDPRTNQTVLFGGLNPYGGTSNPAQFLESTWIFNGSIWKKAYPNNSPSPRAFSSMVYDIRTHQLLLFGGENRPASTLTTLNDTWTWNGSNWIQLHPVTSPSARAAAGMSLAPISDSQNQSSNQSDKSGNHKTHLGVLLFGGLNSLDVALNDTWTWNGSNWIQLHPVTSPSPRAAAGMSLAPIDGQSSTGHKHCIDGIHAGSCGLLLFGGLRGLNLTSGELDDTWTWNGSNWIQLDPMTSPPATGDAVMSLAPITSKNTTNSSLDVVLFGGFGLGSRDLNDTWTWNGLNWIQQSPTSSPSVRGASSIALIPRGNSSPNQTAFNNSKDLTVLLFGGLEGPDALNDTWAWNGTTWTQLFDPKLADPSAQSQGTQAQSPNATSTTSTPPNPNPITQQNVVGVNPLDPPPPIETVIPTTTTTRPPVEPTATTMCTSKQLTANWTSFNGGMGSIGLIITVSASSPCILPAGTPSLRYITTTGSVYAIGGPEASDLKPVIFPKQFAIGNQFTAGFLIGTSDEIGLPQFNVTAVQMQIPRSSTWININIGPPESNGDLPDVQLWGNSGIQHTFGVTPFAPSSVISKYSSGQI